MKAEIAVMVDYEDWIASIKSGGNLDKLIRAFPDLPYTVLGDVRGECVEL